MNLREYAEWLKKHRNKEELKAEEVAKLVIKYHEPVGQDYTLKLFPRKTIKFDGGLLEFDLLIHIGWVGENEVVYDKLIGVEFKETDTQKVITQAIARRDLVDYMYIATRSVWLTEEELLDLFFYGIGWVVWSEEWAHLIFPSKKNRKNCSDLLAKVIKREVDSVVNNKFKNVKLDNFR